MKKAGVPSSRAVDRSKERLRDSVASITYMHIKMEYRVELVLRLMASPTSQGNGGLFDVLTHSPCRC